MVFSRYLYFLILIFVTGCAQVSREQKDVYVQGYRAGVKEQVKSISGKLNGNSFPYYHWTSPIMQEVQVPGHIANGVFIPEHKELVIIKPGEWVQNPSYPINNQGDNDEQASSHSDVSVANITHLPNSHGTSGTAQ